MKNSYKKYFDINALSKKIKALSKKIKSYLPSFNEGTFMKAFKFAEKAHGGQLRKDNKTPYIEHPMKVVEILSDLHADESTIISAILHDVPEDTKHTIKEVRELFGEKVAFLVNGITKLSKVYYKNNMSERQIRSLKKLFLHSSEDLRVILIKLADRLHNMRTLENIPLKEKRLRLAKETMEIYAPIANLLGIQELKFQLEDLCFKTLFPDDYEKLDKRRKKGYKARKEASSKIINILSKKCEEQNLKVRIFDRKKNLYTIYRKVYLQGISLEKIDNRVSLRVVVKNVADCYKALGIVHSNFRPKNDRFRDYIATPKANGYQSLHTTIFGPNGVLMEVQIRTEKMNLESNYGVFAGFFLNNKIESDQQRVAWVKKVLASEKAGTKADSFMENLKLDIFQERIFVFTPKGKPIDLPKGASVLDFAYAVHSDIGYHAVNAFVNGKERNLNYVLTTGNIVDVTTSSGATPNVSWLSFTKTSFARSKIHNYLKRVSNEKKIKEGGRLLQKEFDIAGLGLFRSMNFKKINEAIENSLGLEFKNVDSLLKSIGTGDVKAEKITKIIKNRAPKIKEAKNGKEPNKNKGMRVLIRIVAKNRFGLMNEINEVIYKNVSDVHSFKGWVSKRKETAFFVVEISVKDLSAISRLFNYLEQIKEVIHVYRISKMSSGLIIFFSLLTALFWIFHPFLLLLMEKNILISMHDWQGKLIAYSSLFILIIAVIHLTNIFSKYFPYARKKKRLWAVAFLLPLFATFTLAVEIIYLDFKMNWGLIFAQVFLVYLYFAISFINFRKSLN